LMINPDKHARDELQPVIDLLSAHRPEATALELDATKQVVLARVKRSEKSRSGFMRSRAAILVTLVLGFTLSTAGAGLAVTGLAGNDQASTAQYPSQVVPQPPDKVAPEENGGQVLPSTDSRPAQRPDVQPDRQVVAGVQASDDTQLPFTGFAAIPVLLIGLALLSGGLMMRRSARTD
jgi:hypothetical protein